MTTEPEPAPSDDVGSADNDYGYDLAHEVKDALRIPVTRKRGTTTPTGSGRPPDQDGDLGYDDAHEIRGS
jgi:hypothetical protein